MGLLDGKTAIITGSARGIGRATAELFAAQGAQVTINDIDGDIADQAAGEVRDAYWRAMVPRINYDPDDKLLVLSRLKKFERPRTALALAQFKPD